MILPSKACKIFPSGKVHSVSRGECAVHTTLVFDKDGMPKKLLLRLASFLAKACLAGVCSDFYATSKATHQQGLPMRYSSTGFEKLPDFSLIEADFAEDLDCVLAFHRCASADATGGV